MSLVTLNAQRELTYVEDQRDLTRVGDPKFEFWRHFFSLIGLLHKLFLKIFSCYFLFNRYSDG